MPGDHFYSIVPVMNFFSFMKASILLKPLHIQFIKWAILCNGWKHVKSNLHTQSRIITALLHRLSTTAELRDWLWKHPKRTDSRRIPCSWSALPCSHTASQRRSHPPAPGSSSSEASLHSLRHSFSIILSSAILKVLKNKFSMFLN